MRFEFIPKQGLPKLAWLATVDRIQGAVSVQHGPFVETRENFFIEGVWNGSFDEGDFARTDCIFGTGGISRKESVLFVSSAATTDYLYYHETPERVAVSNSLPLLLSGIDDSLDPHFAGYPLINDSIIYGIDDYIGDIPTHKGNVKRLIYRNLEVFRERIEKVEKRMPPRFHGFEEYYSYLIRNCGLLIQNARESTRTVPLDIFSTQSKGYDTTAVNAIAAKYGVDKVFTVSKGKNNHYLALNDGDKQLDDDGTAICEVLGLQWTSIDRRAFTKNFDEEYLYYAALHNNQDANLKDINGHMRPVSVLLTGALGEIWYPTRCAQHHPYPIDSALRRWDLGCHGLAEIRLVSGFIQLPLPYIGARQREDILRITESSEMEPWSLGTSYDRPIPRRIAEQAGVSRELFGQVKMASVVHFPQPSIPYDEKLRTEFFDYLVSERVTRRAKLSLWRLVRKINTVLELRSDSRYRAVYYFERLVSKLTRRHFRFKPLWQNLNGLLFCFCVNKYAGELSESLNGQRQYPSLHLPRFNASPLSRVKIAENPKPRISVVIATYNSASFIRNTIESVLAQTYSAHEIIVIDDGSTDRTKDVLRGFEHSIRYVYQPNRGPSAARNVGIRLAEGEYICFLDADDAWTPKKLELQLNFLLEHSNIGLVFSDEEEVSINNNGCHSLLANRAFYSDLIEQTPLQNGFRKLLIENFIPTSTVMVRKACFAKAGVFDETLRVVEDRDLWLRIAAYFKIACLPLILGKKLEHESNISTNSELNLRSRIRVWEKMRRLFPHLSHGRVINQLCSEAYLQLGYMLAAKDQRREANKAAVKSLVYALRLPPGVRSATPSIPPYHWGLAFGLLPVTILGFSTTRSLQRATKSLLCKGSLR